MKIFEAYCLCCTSKTPKGYILGLLLVAVCKIQISLKIIVWFCRCSLFKRVLRSSIQPLTLLFLQELCSTSEQLRCNRRSVLAVTLVALDHCDGVQIEFTIRLEWADIKESNSKIQVCARSIQVEGERICGPGF